LCNEQIQIGGVPLNIVAIVSGLCAATLLALSFSGIAPLGGGLESFCELAGVASAVVFFGLVEGA
jgi:hypothetical protein